jgi:hypothetical protein
MTVEWADYQVFDPRVWGPWRDLPRKEARTAFNKAMAEKEERKAQLRLLLEYHGRSLETTDESIDELERWYRAEVQPDPDKPGRMINWWYGVAFDIGLFLGDVMIERAPNLEWELYTGGKTFPYFQRPVIKGFTRSPIPRERVDPDWHVIILGHATIKHDPPSELRFSNLVRSVVDVA